MGGFEARDERFRERVRESFARQPFINFIGGELGRVEAGAVDIALPFNASLAQQHGYVHGGVITAIADAAAGYAALTLAPVGSGVLTTELKVNFLRPAGEGRLEARGRVLKPGRTLRVVQSDVFEIVQALERHVLTGLVTMMFMEGLND
jgi:uncharacterized protein (TIGR00369 family)